MSKSEAVVGQPSKTKRVSMVVWNDMRNDARVRREATSIAELGFCVTVFALHTPGVTSKREKVADGVEIKRVLRSPFWFFSRRSAPREEQTDLANHVSSGMPEQNPTRKIESKFTRIRTIGTILSRVITQVRLVIALSRSKADVVHAHDINVLHLGWLAAKLTGARLIYDAHEISTSREGYRSVRSFVYCVERFLIKRADYVFATTKMRAKYLSRVYKIPRPVPLYNKPDLRAFSPLVQSSRLRDELRLRNDWPIVLYQGGVQSGRGLARLVRSASQITNAYFVFLGSGKQVGELKSLVDELALRNRVFFLPAVSAEELASYTQSADIGVQPIENTCFNHFTTDSNKLFEYACAGLATVASNLPEIRAVVEEFNFGLVFNHRDDNELTFSIRRLVDDERLRQELAANGIGNRANLSWASESLKLKNVYQQIVVFN